MRFLAFLIATIFLISCKDKPEEAQSPEEPTPIEPAGPDVIIETSMGSIRVKLHENIAPVTVANFLAYVDKKHYDGTIFHRVISDFMIQGGGFEMQNSIAKRRPSGKGIINESPKTKSNLRGTLAMARTSIVDSATDQFFINVVNNDGTGPKANLDYPNSNGHGYAVFGHVVEGMEVVDKIKEVETHPTSMLSLNDEGRWFPMDAYDVPVNPVLIKSIRRASAPE